jgi:hypothetical protein
MVQPAPNAWASSTLTYFEKEIALSLSVRLVESLLVGQSKPEQEENRQAIALFAAKQGSEDADFVLASGVPWRAVAAVKL